MLIIVSPTQWSDPISLILSSQNSLVPSNSHPGRDDATPDRNSPNSGPYLVTPARQTGNPPQHQRGVSNPFSVLYDPQSVPSLNVTPDSGEYKSLSYLHIEKELQAGRSPAKASPGKLIPTVTLIDDSELNRAGSVISRNLSTMRHRTIRRRNKMMKRDRHNPSLESVFSSSSNKEKIPKFKPKGSKFSFLFPIKRRTSFKYTPISKQHRRFDSQKEIDDFFSLDNIFAVVREMLPRTMLTFKYKKIAKVIPELHSRPEYFEISKNNSFTRIVHPEIYSTAAPLHATKISLASEKSIKQRIPPAKRASVSSTRRQLFLNTVYKEYREKVFAGKYKVPPRFELLLPFEAGVMKPEEREDMDTKLLLEILLRRTTAAKLEYRLRQNGFLNRSSTSSNNTSDNALSSSSESDPFGPKKDKRNKSGRWGASDLPSYSEPHSASSVYSKPLPSPQISSTSRFGKSPKTSRHHINDISSEIKKDSESSISPLHIIGKDAENTPKSRFTSSSRYSSGSSKQQLTFPTLGIRFDRFMFLSELSEANSLSNMNMYSLQPMNRSVVTVSSALTVDSVLRNKTDKEDHKDPSLPHRPAEDIRASNSTTNTSLFQSLDDLNKSVAQYLRGEEFESPDATI